MATSVASFTICNNPTTYTSATKTATVSWSAGDVILVAYAAANGDQAAGTPTATGLTFTSRVATAGTASSTDVAIFSATAGSSGTSVSVSLTVSGNTDPWCFGVWVITGSPSGVAATGGSTRTTGTGTSTVVSRTTAAGDLVVMVEADWEAAAAGQTLTTGSGTSNKRDNAQSSGQYSYLFGEWVNTGATTANYGSTSYTGRRCSTAALVILAAAGGGSVTGTIASTFGFTGTAVGTPGVDGTVASTFGFTATAVGTPGVDGTAAGNYSFTATAVGAPAKSGTALGDFGGLTATAIGTPGKAGTAASTVTFTATAVGAVDHGGTAVGNLGGLTATAVGVRGVTGAIASTFTFTATASQGSNAVTGTALGDLGALTATAVGVRGVSGSIASTFAFSATATEFGPPLVAWTSGTDVGVPTGTTLTTRTALGSPTSTGTFTLVDPSGRETGSTIDVDIYEAIEFTTNVVFPHSTTGNARLFRNCFFHVVGETRMVEVDEVGHQTSTYMAPRTIFDHCTWDGESTTSRGIQGGNAWLEYCDIKNCEDGWGGMYCSVAIHCNFVANTDGLVDPHADGIQFAGIGRSLVWHCFVSAGEVAGAASQALRVGVEFGSNTDITVAWCGLDGGAGGWTYQVVGGTNTAMSVYDSVILPGGFGSVDFEPGSTITRWERVYSDTYGGTYIPVPVAWPGTISTTFTFTATATGTVGAGGNNVTGTASGAFGALAATAIGARGVTGTALGNLGGLTATVTGVRGVTGSISTTFAFTATAGAIQSVSGVALGAFGGLTATAVGVRGVEGVALGALGNLTATAVGVPQVSGVVATSLSFTAAAVGIRGVLGTALGTFGSVLGPIVTVPPASAQLLSLTLDSGSNALAIDNYANTLELTQ